MDTVLKRISDQMSWVSGSERIRSLLGSISIVFVFNLSTYAARFLVTIFVARHWGPELYGTIALVMSIASMLFIPMAWGQHNTMYKHLPTTPTQRHSTMMWSVLLSNAVIIGLVVATLLFGYQVAIEPLKISLPVWNLAILLAIGNNYQAITEAFLRGKEKFATIGVLKVVSTVVSLAVIIGLLVFNVRSYVGFVFAFAGGMVCFSLLALTQISLKRPKLSLPFIKRSLTYGSVLMVNQIITAVIFEGDVIVLNYLLSKADLGLYAAYLGIVKQLFFIFFVEIFCVVFLPMLANLNREKVFELLSRYSWLIFIGVGLLAGIALFVIISLFGEQYRQSFSYVAISATGIAFFTLFQIYNHLLTMEGNQGARWALVAVVISLPVFFTVIPLLASTYQLKGALIGTASIYCLLFLVMRVTAGIYFNKKLKGTSS
jgi:O-antigen/teichoic acid export membrane protein